MMVLQKLVQYEVHKETQRKSSTDVYFVFSVMRAFLQ